jgi:hypothetical protein
VAARAGIELRRLRFRREAAALAAERARQLRVLGEAVYRDDTEQTERARARVAELDALLAAKEEEMRTTHARMEKRIERAHRESGPTVRRLPPPRAGRRALPGDASAVELPPNVPEPAPVPSDPPGPVIVPEPEPVPHVPPGPVIVPEPQPPDE